LNATGRTGLACKAGDLNYGNFKFASESVNEVSGSVQVRVTPGSAALPTEARGPSEAPVASEETQMTSEVLRHAQNPAASAYRLESQGRFYPGISQFNGGISHRVSKRWD
jgi:hypothetical protein